MELVVTTFNLSDEDLEEESLLQASKPNKRATKRAKTEVSFFLFFSFMRLILVRRGMSVLSLLGSDKEANEKEDGRSDDNTRSDSDVEAITNKKS